MRSQEARFLPWLSSLGVAPEEVSALQGDVSTRRYFRLTSTDPPSAIVAVYPEASAAEAARFVATSALFANAGVRVPDVLASNSEMGLLLLEDLGDTSLFDLRDRGWPELEAWFEVAVQFQRRLARAPTGAFELNPALDTKRLRSELALAQDTFFDSAELLESAAERRQLDETLDALCSGLGEEPGIPLHRDFMARNLMIAGKSDELVVIDHQDACLGPRFYDLASLCNDSVFPSHGSESALLEKFLINPTARAGYRRCAVQRALKAVSTYVRFAARGFDRHLGLVAPTLARAAHHLRRLPEGRSLPRAISARWLDKARVQDALHSTLKTEC